MSLIASTLFWHLGFAFAITRILYYSFFPSTFFPIRKLFTTPVQWLVSLTLSYSLKYKLFMIKIQNNRAKCFFFIEFSVYMGVRFILENSLKGHKLKLFSFQDMNDTNRKKFGNGNLIFLRLGTQKRTKWTDRIYNYRG